MSSPTTTTDRGSGAAQEGRPNGSESATDFGPEFGANEWLVQELYANYLDDPDSVDSAWHDFFADYTPPLGPGPMGPRADSGAPPQRAARDAPPPAAAQSAPPQAAAPGARPQGTAPGAPPQATEPNGPSAPADGAGTGTAAGTGAAATNGSAQAAATPAGTASHPPGGDSSASKPLKGAAARTAANMAASLAVPTATSVRAVPAKLLEDNRTVINRHLARGRGGKVSFTHLIGYALIKSVAVVPVMNTAYSEQDGKPFVVDPDHVNLGLAIDLTKPDGARQLVVAAIRQAERMDFVHFWTAYEDIVRRARTGKLAADDFAGTTISLTNPGGIGTVHSMPRLMQGQGAIIAAGAMEYPAEYQGSSKETLARLAVSKTITLTSTYDHRVIQGAQSGEFLRRMHELLLGADGFYDEVFASLRIPYEPVRWVPDKPSTHEGELDKSARVAELIHAYRVRGHLMADTDPLEFKVRTHPDLDILHHGLTLWDLDREFPVGNFGASDEHGRMMSLRDVLGVLRDSYCRTVGVEYMHLQDPAERRWLQARVERKAERMDSEGQLHVLERLAAAEAFEVFLQTKYVGNKRFSLEGGESTIPILDDLLTAAAQGGLDEVVMGMPHRGRLNVLANIVGKSYSQIFREFEGATGVAHGSGDVKYHLGAQGSFTARTGEQIAVALTSNPSHLEAVDSVLEGVVRAKQDVIDRGYDGFTVLPLLLHGDAAFAGQGVVAETLQMGQLRGYRTGGTVHLVVNNQVGFTTAPGSARSSVYATDVARMVQAPILHVNGDDPEACVRVARLSFEFRQQFHKDVVIDLVCYRRRGHSEVDEPSFTQPLMYRTIESKRSVRKLYTEALIGRGEISVAEAEAALRSYQNHLDEVFRQTRQASSLPPATPEMDDAAIDTSDVDTTISVEVLKRLADTQVNLPDGFTAHKKLAASLQARPKMLADDAVDWSFAETLALGSLLLDGHPVRLAGQDTRRGTFGQRHAVVVDQQTGEEFFPLRAFDPDQATFYVYDSPLSEFAALGFEYGYSVTRAEALVAWEAQFGDFVNGAQPIIDEFVAAGEAKWGQRSGLVLLLPHGYEGQGPDHSSARIERFLSLCAENNMTITQPSVPANHFHLLRLQCHAPARRPLVVFTPKSMLRLRAATSPTSDFTDRGFRPVIPDVGIADEPLEPAGVRRLLLCSGKVYYDLADARAKAGRTDVAIARVEQLYPTPGDHLREVVASYPALRDLVWVQEEPANQGAWPFMALSLPELLPDAPRLVRVSRPAAASPASGSPTVHGVEQKAVISAALGN